MTPDEKMHRFCVKWRKINLAQRIDTPFGIQPSGACGDMRYPSPRAAESDGTGAGSVNSLLR